MIKFGMTLMEMIGQLTRGYVKATGKQPDNLARIKIRQEALKRLEDQKKVVSLETKKPIDTSKGIMGGRQIEDDLPPPGSRGGKDDIAAPIQSAEQSIEDVLDSAIDNVSPGFANDLKVDATLVAEDVAEKLGLKYDDLPIREQVKIYGKSYDRLAKKRFEEKETKRLMDDMKKIEDPEDMAEGGRIGLKTGMTRRAFLALMGSIGAGIGAAKSGLLSLTGKQAAKEVAKQTVTPTSPPPYFFELAEKIKKYGKPSKVQPQERVNEYSYTGKNGDEYTMTEDITSGDIEIIKDKTGVASYGEKTFDTINNRSVMQYKSGKGMADEGTKGTPADEYDEYEVIFDRDGTMADADDMAEQIKKEIIEEAKTDVPPIKKAGGGLAYMLGE
jgi:hypothetical protein